MKIVVYNLGCKVNQYECDALVKALKERGYNVSENLESADCYLLNTCAVTNEAERKSRQCVTRVLKLNPKAKVVVCGCASQNNPEQFKSKDGVTFIGGVADKASLVDKLEEEGIVIKELPAVYEDEMRAEINRTRAYVKIQDGCNRFCSYCLIPYLRGRSRSRVVDSIVEECERLSTQTNEIVLTGVDISMYGKDIGTDLTTLILRLKHIDCRIRFGSLEVSMIIPGLLNSLKELKVFCPQFHLSLQSGDDEVLKKMNRHYDTDEYYREVELIREYFPNAGITTDIICGFPLENEQQHINTLDYIRKVGFSQVHVFGYSPRKGTVAAKYDPLSPSIIKRRCAECASVAGESKTKYLDCMMGEVVEVLTEEESGEYIVGYSREYIRCYIKDASANTVVKAKIKNKYKDGVIAEIL